MVTGRHGRVQSSKMHMSPAVCITAEAGQGHTLPSAFSSDTQNKCLFHDPFNATFLFLFFLFFVFTRL